jgi:segregation and condensation protein A
MEFLNLDIAGEFILMAATLAHIKSKMLLPKEAGIDEGEEEIDPRAELVAQLLEYQKYKDAAEKLSNRELLNRDVFSRGGTSEPPLSAEGTEPALEATLFQLLDAFQGVLTKIKHLKDYEVTSEPVSVREMMMLIGERLKREKSFSFESLFDKTSRKAQLIATFLALLELLRLTAAVAYQQDQFGPVYIYSNIDENANIGKYLELVEE